MKFLCVPCDSPMKLQEVVPPERGSLSVVYACPECGYEIAMLTNAYETQVVQSLGVRIGPDRARASAEGSAAEAGTSASGCPFAAMIPVSAKAAGGQPATGEAHSEPTQPVAVQWTAAAEARLENIPAFVRPMARTGIESFARERGRQEIDEQTLDAAREFFGM
jgi:hypothetical protein